MYDLCGSRDDGDALNCAANVPDANVARKRRAVCPRLADEPSSRVALNIFHTPKG